jgi:hypothetical protein
MRRAAAGLLILLALALGAVAQEHGAEPAKEARGEAHGETHGEAPPPDMTGWKWANFAILAAGL